MRSAPSTPAHTHLARLCSELALGLALLRSTVLQAQGRKAQSVGVALVQPPHPVRLVVDVVGDVLQVLQVGPRKNETHPNHLLFGLNSQ